MLNLSEDNLKEDTVIKITALMIHAAKIDDNYTDKEKLIIKNFIKSIDNKFDQEKILDKAEIDEKNSNQILKYTQEVKKNTLKFRTEIVKVLWKIILSDNNPDVYESNLMRRICGLLYLPDKISGEIKLEILREKKL
tara:strand:- start:1583 stop:1993 length:411 start_codon:yes stop_codon:yes gene_type:complete